MFLKLGLFGQSTLRLVAILGFGLDLGIKDTQGVFTTVSI